MIFEGLARCRPPKNLSWLKSHVTIRVANCFFVFHAFALSSVQARKVTEAIQVADSVMPESSHCHWLRHTLFPVVEETQPNRSTTFVSLHKFADNWLGLPLPAVWFTDIRICKQRCLRYAVVTQHASWIALQSHLLPRMPEYM